MVKNHCEGCGSVFEDEHDELMCSVCVPRDVIVLDAEERLHHRSVTSHHFGPSVPHRGTDADYEMLLIDQGGRCAICGEEPTRKPLVMDHNHKTGQIRGLLCSRCNHGIGMLGDHPIVLDKAAAYLRRKGHYGTWPR